MTATTSRNAFIYGMTESFGETAVAATLTTARYAVIGWDWYTATFFSAKAKHTYVTIGEALGHLMIATILVGAMAGVRYRAWVDAEVQSCLAKPPIDHIPDAGEMVPDPFGPTVNEHYPAMAATMAAPVATLVVPVAKGKTPTTAELRKRCQSAGIKWRNAHGKGRHLTKAEMVAALQEMDCWALSEGCLA